MKDKLILDVCCGGRMFWFNKKHSNAIYIDKRYEPKGFIKNRSSYEVIPDIVADFRNIPFKDKRFKHVVFDPPHLLKGGLNGWQVQKYGKLNKETWREDLKQGFSECWRVLDDFGTLVFKWNEHDVSHREVLDLFNIEPLYGHPTGRSGKTKWFVFMKIPGQKTLHKYNNVKENEDEGL